MFTEEIKHRDWIIGVVAFVLIVGGLYWIRSQPIEQPTQLMAPEPQAVASNESSSAV